MMQSLFYACSLWLLGAATAPMSENAASDNFALAQLLQDADQALMHHQFERARALYEALLSQMGTQPPSFCDRQIIALDLAQCEKELGHPEAARRLLTELLRGELEPPRKIQAQMLLAHICAGLGNNEEAYALLQLIEKVVPREEWTQQDRSLGTHLSLLLDDLCEQRLRRAQSAFSAGDFLTALEQSKQALSAVEHGTYPLAVRQSCSSDLCQCLRFRIAECHYLLGDDQATLEWLQDCGDAATSRSSLLMGCAFQRSGQPTEAIRCFTLFLATNEPTNAETEEVEWRLGRACFAAERLEEARIYFYRRLQQQPSEELQQIAHLYLARIDCRQGDLISAQSRVDLLRPQVTAGHPLFREFCATGGQIAFEQQAHLEAIRLLELALSEPIQPPPPWYEEALYYLGSSYLEFAALQPPNVAESLLGRAESVFRQATLLFPAPRHREGLAQVAATKARRFPAATEGVGLTAALHGGQATP
jgi:tetratricopeptide (TPR) repeat protein